MVKKKRYKNSTINYFNEKLKITKHIHINMLAFIFIVVVFFFMLYESWYHGQEINRINSIIERIDMNVKIDGRIFRLVDEKCLKEEF